MRKFVMANLAIFMVTLLVPVSVVRAEGVKQPVFLICPHQKKYSAWSVYLNVDPSNPEKVLGLGLDELSGINSVDSGGYEGAQAAQADAKTKRENLGTLSVDQFGKGQIKIEKNDALHLGVESAGNGTYRLLISMRCTSDQRFVVGGKEQKKRDIVLKYDKGSKTWQAVAEKMTDINGKAVLNPGTQIQGIMFPVTGTGIYRIVGMLPGGDSALLVDGWRKDSE